MEPPMSDLIAGKGGGKNPRPHQKETFLDSNLAQGGVAGWGTCYRSS